MAETSHPRPEPGDDEMHWGISYLREDIQDVRAQIVRLEAKFDDRFNRLETKLDDRLNRHESRFVEIEQVIREQGRELTQRMVLLAGLMTTALLAAIKL
ncbi:MAG TPA: hypothetical protein QGF95_17920 [Candidatus Latescibacteria bacterium]|jgi:Holliday junction resolvasome RuvABC endonuclease subunit|nr:hypothetical protein [Gemmatimonadaceae bacterium]HJP32427.1 hypothetical protein [Candidatus Latescibacterota bacterium]